jgi:hypothetical protein
MMAILMYFNQIRESATEVEYKFGPTKDNLHHHLTIVKQTWTTLVPTGQPEGLTREMAGWIMHRQKQKGEWPKTGALMA